MTTLQKLIAALVVLTAVCLGVGVVVDAYQRGQGAEIQALRQELGAAKAASAAWEDKAKKEAQEGQEWKGRADAAMARLGALESRLKGVEARLAAMGPQAPATDTSSLPTEAVAIAAAMTKAGVQAIPMQPPPVAGVEVGLGAPAAQKALGLILDGTNYPSALERIQALGEEVGILDQQKAAALEAVDGQTKRAEKAEAAYAAETQAKAECEKAAAITEQIVQDKDKELKAERVKKWTWSGAAAAITALVFLL